MKALLAGLTLMLAGCSAAVQQAPVFDPVGVYDFTTDVQGTPVSGTITLRRTDTGYSGTVSSDMTGDMPASATVTGRRAELRANTEQGPLTLSFDVAEDDTIAGSWQIAGGPTGTFAGRRR
jgi:hypothetical protein